VNAPIPFDEAEWMRDAACRGHDQDTFFPGRGESNKPAKAVCAGCNVHAECLEYALRNGIIHGVWGGRSERERRRMRSTRTKPCAHCSNPFGATNGHERYCSDECRRVAHNKMSAASYRRRAM
jgi:WhiB family redox-sensing transcriptional regulator